jgi:hypothetical protein
VLSSYEITSEGTKEQVSIIDLLDINADGLVHLKEKYYKGVSDTTYHITDDLMNKLNAIFDGSKKLTTYMVMNKLPEGRHFAGALQYL